VEIAIGRLKRNKSLDTDKLQKYRIHVSFVRNDFLYATIIKILVFILVSLFLYIPYILLEKYLQKREFTKQ